MNNVVAVAEVVKGYIGDMGIMKLNKLIYLCHGYCLALYGYPLVKERFEAWNYGPVCEELYRGGDAMGEVSEQDMLLIERVCELYKGHTAIELATLVGDRVGPWYRGWSHPWRIMDNETILEYFRGKLGMVP